MVRVVCTSEVLTSTSMIKRIAHLTNQIMSTFHIFADTEAVKTWNKLQSHELTKRTESKLLHFFTVSLLIQTCCFWLMDERYVNIYSEIWLLCCTRGWFYPDLNQSLNATCSMRFLFVLHTYWKITIGQNGTVSMVLFRKKMTFNIWPYKVKRSAYISSKQLNILNKKESDLCQWQETAREFDRKSSMTSMYATAFSPGF